MQAQKRKLEWEQVRRRCEEGKFAGKENEGKQIGVSEKVKGEKVRSQRSASKSSSRSRRKSPSVRISKSTRTLSPRKRSIAEGLGSMRSSTSKNTNSKRRSSSRKRSTSRNSNSKRKSLSLESRGRNARNALRRMSPSRKRSPSMRRAVSGKRSTSGRRSPPRRGSASRKRSPSPRQTTTRRKSLSRRRSPSRRRSVSRKRSAPATRRSLPKERSPLHKKSRPRKRSSPRKTASVIPSHSAWQPAFSTDIGRICKELGSQTRSAPHSEESRRKSVSPVHDVREIVVQLPNEDDLAAQESSPARRVALLSSPGRSRNRSREATFKIPSGRRSRSQDRGSALDPSSGRFKQRTLTVSRSRSPLECRSRSRSRSRTPAKSRLGQRVPVKARLGLRRDVQSRLGARRRPDAKKVKKNWAKEESLAEDSSYATIDQVFAVFLQNHFSSTVHCPTRMHIWDTLSKF